MRYGQRNVIDRKLSTGFRSETPSSRALTKTSERNHSKAEPTSERGPLLLPSFLDWLIAGIPCLDYLRFQVCSLATGGVHF